MALNPRQRAYVEHFLTCWNATEAARRAGYSEKSARKQGYRMSTNVDIRSAIEDRLAAMKMGTDEVLVRLAEQARSTIADFIDVTAPSADVGGAASMDEAHAIVGGWRINLAKAEQLGKLHLIKKLKSGQWGPELELHDSQTALLAQAKILGLMVEKVEHSGEIAGKVYAGFDPDKV